MSSPRELLEPFLLELSLFLNLSTVGAYRYQLGCFFDYLEAQGVEHVGSVTHAVWDSYGHRLNTVPGKRGKLFSDSYKHLALQVPRSFLDWAYHRGHTLIDFESYPLSRAPLPSQKSIPSVAQIRKLLESPDTSNPRGLRDRLILDVFYTLGLRRQESLALDIGDINFKQQSLRVMGKGQRERCLPLTDRLSKLLSDYLKDVRPHLRPFPDEQAFWVSTYSGRRLTAESVSNIVMRHSKEVGLEGMHAHLLRHCCATHLLEAGATPKQIQTILGHVQAGSTDHYTHVSTEELKREFKRCHPRAHDCPTGAPFHRPVKAGAPVGPVS